MRLVVLVALLFPMAAAASTEAFHTEYPTVLKDEGGVYRMWYSGFGTDASGVAAWRIHYATSTDGIEWQRHGVVLDRGAAESWDESGVAFPCVIRRGGKYLMWYGGQVKGRYSIGFATSPDGVQWTRHGDAVLVAEPRADGWETEGVVDPAVIYDEAKQQYLMWFNGLGTRYGYGFATSPDGIAWRKHPANPVLGTGSWRDWDGTAPYTLAVLRDRGQYKLWYAVGLNGRGASLGLATSRDGVRWTKARANPFTIAPIGSQDAWNSYGDFFYGPSVLRDGGVLKMWVNGIGGANAKYGAIGYATSKDGVTWAKGAQFPVVCPDGWTNGTDVTN